MSTSANLASYNVLSNVPAWTLDIWRISYMCRFRLESTGFKGRHDDLRRIKSSRGPLLHVTLFFPSLLIAFCFATVLVSNKGKHNNKKRVNLEIWCQTIEFKMSPYIFQTLSLEEERSAGTYVRKRSSGIYGWIYGWWKVMGQKVSLSGRQCSPQALSADQLY